MDNELIKILAIFTVMSLVVSVLLYLAINSWRGCKRDKKKVEEMLTWPTITATVKDWKVVEGAGFRGKYRHFAPKITYHYYLDGMAYLIDVKDKKFYFGDSLESKQDAERKAAALGRAIVEEGKRTDVYYNPKDPSESVVEIGDLGSCASIFVVVVILSIVLLVSASIALFVLASFVIPLFRR